MCVIFLCVYTDVISIIVYVCMCVILLCVYMYVCYCTLCVYGYDIYYCVCLYVCYFLSVWRLARRVRREQTPSVCVYGCNFYYCVCMCVISLSVCRLARRVRREQTPRSRNSCWDGSARVSQTSPHSRRPLEAPTWSALTRLTQSTLTIRESEHPSVCPFHAVHPNYPWVWGGHWRLLHGQRWPGSCSPP